MSFDTLEEAIAHRSSLDRELSAIFKALPKRPWPRRQFAYKAIAERHLTPEAIDERRANVDQIEQCLKSLDCDLSSDDSHQPRGHYTQTEYEAYAEKWYPNLLEDAGKLLIFGTPYTERFFAAEQRRMADENDAWRKAFTPRQVERWTRSLEIRKQLHDVEWNIADLKREQYLAASKAEWPDIDNWSVSIPF
jgi:hypothetical protein